MRTIVTVFLFLCGSTLMGQTENYYPTRFYAKGENDYPKSQKIPENFFHTPVQPPASTFKGNNICFNNVYYVRHNTTFLDVLEDASSCYYLAGYCQHQTSNLFDSTRHVVLLRMKVDKSGNTIWTHEDSLAHGFHFRMNNRSFVFLTDSSIIAIGGLHNDFQSLKDYEYRLPIYQRFDKDGNLFFSKLIADTIGRRFGFWPQDVVAEPDMGFTVAGFIGSQTRKWQPQLEYWQHDTTYIAIISYDSLGNETNRALHYVGGEPRTPGIDGLIKLANGDYLISGTQLYNWPASGLRKNYTLRIDSNFNYVSVNTYGQMMGEIYVQHHIIPSQYGGYCFAVNLADTPIIQHIYEPQYTYYYHVGRMDSAFNIIKDTIFRIPGYHPPHELRAGIIMGIDELENGDIITTGRHAQGADVFWFDDNINIHRYRHIWHYPGVYPNLVLNLNLRKASDGGVLLVSGNMGTHRGGWFVKTDSLGFSLPDGGDTLMYIGIEMHSQQTLKKELTAYPNPVADHLTIQTKDNSTLPQGTLLIFNIQGALQKEVTIPAYQNQMQLNLNHLPAGLYFGRIVSKTGDGVGFKFVKQ